MVKKKLKLSIIVPVFNEENYLQACLDSIASQTVPPHQIIIVDNNSTDKSAAIATSYDFVTLIKEERQGQVYAQAAGFDEATGDIIGRIDADSILPPTWVKQVLDVFADDSVVAFTGSPDPYDIPFKWLAVLLFKFYHDYVTAWTAGTPLLYGSNCAFARELWPKAKPHLRMKPDIWEDYDLGFVLSRYGRIVWRPDITVGCSFRKFRENFIYQLRYYYKPVRTFSLHVSWWRTGLQGLLRATILFGLPMVLINKALIKLRLVSQD